MANPYFPTPAHGVNRLNQWFWRQDGWAYIVAVTLLLVIGLGAGIQQHWLWIEHITISGNEYLTQDQITSQVNIALDQHRWYIVPQRLFPFTDTNVLVSEITKGLHDTLSLESIAVTKEFPNQINVTVKERVPGLVYILNDQYYYLDDTGVLTAEVAVADLDPHFPHIRERNTSRTVAVNQAISQSSVMGFIVKLDDQFTATTNLNIAEYYIPQLSCQTKEFIEKNAAAPEAESDATEDPVIAELRNQQSRILDQIRQQEITVDEGLQLLDTLQTEEATTTDGISADGITGQYIDVEATYVEASCDYAAVIRDIGIVTREGPEIIFDTSLDLQNQLTHLAQVITDQAPDLTKVTYFDLRFPDRVYYQ